MARPISESGIFPKKTTKAPSADLVSSLFVWSGGHTHDVRVRVNQQGTDAELTQLVNMGYIVKYDSLEAFSAVYPGVIVKLVIEMRVIVDNGVQDSTNFRC